MGEHATYNGETIKIGTCEDLFYLRADQRHLIQGYHFDESLRYRFPFPDEDGVEPGGGSFGDHDRGVRIPGWGLPAEFADGHGSVQFTSTAGYVLSIPCPEQHGQPGLRVEMPDGLVVHRNGFNGSPEVRQQRILGGETVTVVACNACGAKWRLDREAAADVAAAFLDESERQECGRDGWGPANGGQQRAFLQTMAARILAGYDDDEGGH